MLFLGLDISTNCTGYSYIDENEKLIDINFIDTSKEKTWIDKALLFRSSISKLLQPDKIGIEDLMSKFMSGMSTSKTIISLARFNGLATFFCADHFGINPIHINVLRARNNAGIKVPRGVSSKDFVLNSIREKYADIIWPLDKKERIAKQSYDMADSLVIALSLKRSSD